MYRITRALSIGRYASAERGTMLLAHGVTHVLNVSDADSVVGSGPASFREVAWVPIRDFRHIPEMTAIRALDILHRMASEPESHVYIHCIAGQQRAPAVLWLYLIACDHTDERARALIELRSPDAVLRQNRMLNGDLAAHVRAHGRAHYLPHPRREALAPLGEADSAP